MDSYVTVKQFLYILLEIYLTEQKKSGLLDAINVTKKLKEIEHIQFSEKDVVRHPLVTKIVKSYNERKQRR